MSFVPTKIQPEHLEEVVETIKNMGRSFNKRFCAKQIERFLDVLNTSLYYHKRTLVVSFALYSPVDEGDKVINNFIDRFRVETIKELKVRKKKINARYKEALKTFKRKGGKRPSKMSNSRFKTRIGHFFTRHITWDGKTNRFTGMIFLNRDAFGDVNPRGVSYIDKEESYDDVKNPVLNPTRIHNLINKVWFSLFKEPKKPQACINISYYLLDVNDPQIVQYVTQTTIKAIEYVRIKNSGKNSTFTSVLKVPMKKSVKKAIIQQGWQYDYIENTSFSSRKNRIRKPRYTERLYIISDTYYGKKRRRVMPTVDIPIDEPTIKEYFCDLGYHRN